MLRKTILMSENINNANFQQLKAFVENKNVGHKKKKAHVLTTDQIKSFLENAPDEHYLVTKVIFFIFFYVL